MFLETEGLPEFHILKILLALIYDFGKFPDTIPRVYRLGGKLPK
jgi:hypothetical protein